MTEGGVEIDKAAELAVRRLSWIELPLPDCQAAVVVGACCVQFLRIRGECSCSDLCENLSCFYAKLPPSATSSWKPWGPVRNRGAFHGRFLSAAEDRGRGRRITGHEARRYGDGRPHRAQQEFLTAINQQLPSSSWITRGSRFSRCLRTPCPARDGWGVGP